MVDSIGGINGMLNAYYASASQTGSVGAVSPVFDHKAALQQSQALMDSFRGNQASLKNLKKDSASFLDSYTKSMNTLASAAKPLDVGNIYGLMYNRQGESSEAGVKKTVDAARTLVDAYNASLKLLNENADRGPGVMKQIARMSDDPAPEATLKMLGITVNKDATLSLDSEKLSEVLSSENPEQQRFFMGLLSDVSVGIQRDARAGLNTAAGALIGNDLARMQSVRDEDPFTSMVASLKGGGAYALNNQAAAGMLMSILV